MIPANVSLVSFLIGCGGAFPVSMGNGSSVRPIGDSTKVGLLMMGPDVTITGAGVWGGGRDSVLSALPLSVGS